MKGLRNALCCLMLIGVLLGCDSQPEIITTKNGIRFNLIEAGDGEMAAPGSIMLMDIAAIDELDSTWINSFNEGVPRARKKPDSLWRLTEGGIDEVMFYLKKGDSINFKMSASNMFRRGKKPLRKEDSYFLTVNLRVVDVMTMSEYRLWQEGAVKILRAKQQLSDSLAITKYLHDNSVNAQVTDNGIHYVIHEQGNGEKLKLGQKIVVNYTGYTLSGKFFDSTNKGVALDKGLYDERKEPYEPYSFVLGEDKVIQGWVDAFQLFNKGTKATIYVPSRLAYGRRPMGKIIRPNSNLVFDIEIIDIMDVIE